MGVVGLTAPEEHGGLGMDETGLVLLLEEAGRVALPEPLAQTTAVGIPMLRDAMPNPIGERLLSKAAGGDIKLGVALARSPMVAHAEETDVFLMERADSLYAIPRGAVTITPGFSVDPTWTVGTVEWNADPESLLLEGPAARDAAELAFDRGALGAAGHLLGVSARMIEMGAAYAKERVQFGKPVGSYQAVKHLLANALVRLEFARPAVYRAAWSVANDVPERSRDVSMAKALASEAALGAAKASLQVHGAIGYTEEHDLHIWLKRARSVASSWGTASWHRERVAARVLGSGVSG
jgi:alkylation response protein AidB-like acyl-CoA dehydrogenase